MKLTLCHEKRDLFQQFSKKIKKANKKCILEVINVKLLKI